VRRGPPIVIRIVSYESIAPIQFEGPCPDWPAADNEGIPISSCRAGCACRTELMARRVLTSFSSYKPGPEGTLFHLNLAAGRRSTYVLLYSSCRARAALVVWQGGAMADPITIGVLTLLSQNAAGDRS
jgi:hypothetical protein